MPTTTEWQRLVADSLIADSYAQQRTALHHLVTAGTEPGQLPAWVAEKLPPGSPVQAVLADMARTPIPDLAMLTIASQRLRAAVGS